MALKCWEPRCVRAWTRCRCWSRWCVRRSHTSGSPCSSSWTTASSRRVRKDSSALGRDPGKRWVEIETLSVWICAQGSVQCLSKYMVAYLYDFTVKIHVICLYYKQNTCRGRQRPGDVSCNSTTNVWPHAKSETYILKLRCTINRIIRNVYKWFTLQI